MSSSSPLGNPPSYGSGGSGGGDDGCGVIIAFALIFGIPLGVLFFIYSKLGEEVFWFSAKMIMISFTVALIPSISSFISTNLLIRALIDVLIFSFFVVGAFWLLNFNLSLPWIGYFISLIALLEVGGVLVQFNMNYTLHNIQKISDESLWGITIEKAKRIFLYGQILYVTIPLSMLGGTIVGMIRVTPPIDTLQLTFFISAGVFSIGLFFIAIREFVNMSHPLVYMNIPKKTRLNTRLDRAFTISEIRKIYLVDSVHSIVLLVSISAGIFYLNNFNSKTTIILLLSLFLLLFIFV